MSSQDNRDGGLSHYNHVMDLARQYDSYHKMLPGTTGLVSLGGCDIWRFAKALCEEQNVCMHRRFNDPPLPKIVVEANAKIKALEEENALLKLQLGLTAIAVAAQSKTSASLA